MRLALHQLLKLQLDKQVGKYNSILKVSNNAIVLVIITHSNMILEQNTNGGIQVCRLFLPFISTVYFYCLFLLLN